MTWCFKVGKQNQSFCFFSLAETRDTECESVKEEAPVSLEKEAVMNHCHFFLKADCFALQTSSTSMSLDRVCLPQELSSVVYTTVDFRAHQGLTELYANLRTNRPLASEPAEDGMVEYSTLAVHQWWCHRVSDVGLIASLTTLIISHFDTNIHVSWFLLNTPGSGCRNTCSLYSLAVLFNRGCSI